VPLNATLRAQHAACVVTAMGAWSWWKGPEEAVKCSLLKIIKSMILDLMMPEVSSNITQSMTR